jgi:hypothetical protein
LANHGKKKSELTTLTITYFIDEKQLFADNFVVNAKNILLNAIKHILLDPEILFVL